MERTPPPVQFGVFGRTLAALALLGALLSGCASTPMPVPEGYKGPLARVFDTHHSVSSTRVYFFQLDKVDGRTIKTSSWETHDYNYPFPQGYRMAVRLNDRFIPAGKTVLTLEGMTHVATGIFAFTGGMYHVSGDVTVVLEPRKSYYVKGELSKAYSAVWLEDAEGHIVSNKIEKRK